MRDLTWYHEIVDTTPMKDAARQNEEVPNGVVVVWADKKA